MCIRLLAGLLTCTSSFTDLQRDHSIGLVLQITAGGKAAKGGIRFGDYIVEINGDPTESLLHSDAMMLIKTTGVTLNLKVTK